MTPAIPETAAALRWVQMGFARQIVINVLGVDKARFDLSPDTQLIDDLGADSLDMVEIQTLLTGHGIAAPNDVFTSHMRLRDLASLIVVPA